ncbi:hypothetical protein BH24ACT3_BH24ACT3_14080 [soil metagenome]
MDGDAAAAPVGRGATLVLAAALVVAVAACGGGDDAASDDTLPAPSTTEIASDDLDRYTQIFDAGRTEATAAVDAGGISRVEELTLTPTNFSLTAKVEVVDRSRPPIDAALDATTKLAAALWRPEQVGDLAEPPKFQVHSFVTSWFCPGEFMAELAAGAPAPTVDEFEAVCPTP